MANINFNMQDIIVKSHPASKIASGHHNHMAAEEVAREENRKIEEEKAREFSHRAGEIKDKKRDKQNPPKKNKEQGNLDIIV